MSSGHNPHSRMSQPVNSSSWNHLQVPSSYMPRQQPQLAHMSSERTLRSSPLIWPNTNPADAFYNYMALTAAAAVANSNPKNTTLDMNPLLPFVRTPMNPMPFNSVDLSLSATTTNTNRNSLTPSPRNYPVSPSSSTSNNRFAIKSTADDPDDSTNNKIDDSNKLNTDPIAFLSEMSEQLASMRTNRNLATSTTIPRDTNNLNSDLPNFRINGGNEKQSKQRNEAMELGRESNAAANFFENESLTNSVHLQQLLGLTPPITSSITPNLNDLSKSILSMFSNTASASSMLISPKSQSNFHSRQPDTSTAKNCLNISNDDSLDSQSGTCNGDDVVGRRYRRRKPQKTVRMSNEMNATTGTSTLDSEKIIQNDSKCENNANGINFPSFRSDATNRILTPSPLPPPTTTIVQPPQTQSMDLSHHCTNPEIFENGLVNYSKANDSNMANSTVGERCDKDANLLQNDEMNGLNLFGAFSHLSRVANLTNDIATFPNTDDLVKKVEELVKCNEQNGFGSNTNKLVSDAFENNRVANGISMESLKMSNNSVEHANKHSNTIKCNGNGVIPGMIQSNLNEKIENKTHENNCHDEEVKMSNAISSNSEKNGEIARINSDTSGKIFEATNSTDLIYDKQTNNDIINHSNIDVSSASVEPNSSSSIDNEINNENVNKFNGNDVAKGTISASSSDSQPSNASPTPKNKGNVTKKKATNQRCNGKIGKQNNTNKKNQKNAKSNDKSEKKSDIKKTKIKDDSLATETLNKFRGPYVHVERNGSVNVINAPLTEEIAEKQSKFKKNYISQRPADRNKVRGLHVSTLSKRYDAITADISWMCVFCKLGPHKYGLGDLFGPFILSTESEDFQLAQIDPKNDVFKSWHRNRNNMAFMQNISAVAAKSLSKSANAGNPVTSVKKKRKLNQLDNGITSNSSGHTIECNAQHNEIDIFYGMTQATDSSYEVWAHEDCIVWASGVHIIGLRVVGLETAVWGSVRHQCGICKQYGAMLSCLQRNCNNEVHVPCAKRCDWILDEHCFQSRCSEHALVNDNNR